MCLFTHFAAGALAGGATGNIYVGAVAGLASHAVLDAIPHYDHPDWRLELAGGVMSLLLLLMLPFGSAAAVVGGIFGVVPDLENLFQKLGWMGRNRFVFPSHTGLVPHGRNLGPRSLVWQVAIFVACFGALGLLQPGEAVAATDRTAVMARPVTRVLSADVGRTVVRVEFPVDRAPDDWSAVSPGDVIWAMGSEDPVDGAPAVPPRYGVALAVPTRRAPEVRVADVIWWRRPDRDPDLPALLVADPPAVARGVPITGVKVPLGAAGGVLAGVTLEFIHGPDVRGRAQLAAAERRVATKAVGAVFPPPAGLVNPDLHVALTAGDRVLATAPTATADKFQPTALFGLTSNWVRLTVDTDGLYSLTGQDLVNLGIPTTDVDLTKLRVYRGGGQQILQDPEIPDADQSRRVGLNETTIQIVEGTPDGEWNLDDEIRFYAVSTSTWRDRLTPGGERLDHYDHIYCDAAVYWLTWESDAVASPLPGTPRRVIAVDATPGVGPVRATGQVRLHAEEQFYENRGLVEDNWTWQQRVISSESKTFQAHRPVAGSTARFMVDVRGGAFLTHVAEAYLNDDRAHADTVTTTATIQRDSLRVRLIGDSASIRAGSNLMVLRDLSESSSARLALDSFDIMYEDSLVLESGYGMLAFGLWGDLVPTPATSEVLRIAAEVPADAILWDVSVPDSALVLGGAAAVGYAEWQVLRDPGIDRHFVAARRADLKSVRGARRVSPRDLASLGSDLDYIVIAPTAFMSAAGTLADFRSQDLPGVTNPRAIAVDVQDVYDNFAGGQKDLRAIRSYLRWVYEEGGHRLAYVCLLGNTSRDPRNYRDGTDHIDLTDLVPTDIRTVFPSLGRLHTSTDAYASDDEVASFDTRPAGSFLSPGLDRPDLACGRLPAVTVAEAGAMVSRTIEHTSEPPEGPWRNRIMLVADDATQDGWPVPYEGAMDHTEKSEDVGRLLLPTVLDQVKVYGIDHPFPPGSNIKSAAQRDIQDALNEGTTLFYYVGHGSEDNLGDEQYFRLGMISGLTNGLRRPLFVAFSCDVGVIDDFSVRALVAEFVAAENGGAIAAIGASQVSYINENEEFTDAFFSELYPDVQVDRTVGIGAALMRAKGRVVSDFSVVNSQRYNLLGDPALRMPHHARDLSLAATSLDTLRPGILQHVVFDGADQGELLGAGDPWDLRVEESAREELFRSYTRYWNVDTETYVYVPHDFPWLRMGGPAFRTSGVLADSDLDVPFKASTQSRTGDRARVRLIVDERSAVQIMPAVRTDLSGVDDIVGPQIALAFADNRIRVTPGTALVASLQDTSSIAVLGTAPGNSINLEFDDSGFWTDVTDAFVFSPGDHTRGDLSVEIPADLLPGSHLVALYAADALGNVGTDTLSFELVTSAADGIYGMAVFPNPTPGPCRLVFDLATSMKVQWDIYTTAGRRVRTWHSPGAMGAGLQTVPWDGRDQEGDEIANGTYLYVLRGLGGGRDGTDLTETGKLVIMR